MSQKFGCLTTNNIDDTDFLHSSNVKSIDQCFKHAKDLTCNDQTCSYIGYKRNDVQKILDNAEKQYKKKKDEKKLKKIFNRAWTCMEPEERRDQLRDPEPYLKHLIKKYGKKYYEKRINNKTTCGGECWIGGNNVLEGDYINSVKDYDENKECVDRYVYEVPTNGFVDLLKRDMPNKVLEAKNNLKNAQREYVGTLAQLNFLNQNKNEDQSLLSFVEGAKKSRMQAEAEVESEQTRKDINNLASYIKEKKESSKIINTLDQLTKQTVAKNTQLVKDNERKNQKINSNIQTLNWSLKESKSQEDLYNKISTTLGIIIVLFSVLCAVTIVYYAIKKGKPENAVNNLLGKNNVASSNKKLLSKLF
jgi:hypothetical protein